MAGEGHDPGVYRAVIVIRGGDNGRELVEKSLLAHWRGSIEPVLRRVLRDAVQDHGSVTQMDMIARHADEALDQDQVLRVAIRVWFGFRGWPDEDYDIPALRLAIVDQPHPPGGGGP